MLFLCIRSLSLNSLLSSSEVGYWLSKLRERFYSLLPGILEKRVVKENSSRANLSQYWEE